MTVKSVVYIVKMFPRLSETFIINEILGLEASGLKIRIVSLHRSDSQVVHQATKSVRAQVYYLPESFWSDLPHMVRAQAHFLTHHPRRWLRTFVYMFFRHSLKATKLWFQAASVAQLLEGTNVGHIHAHFSTAPTAVAMMAARLLDLGFSFTCHAKDVYAGGRLFQPGFFRNLSRATFVVCVSTQTKKDILNAWPQIPTEKILVIYNGLDLEKFQLRSTEPYERLILAVGRLVEKKGFSYLIKACQLLKRRSIAFRCEIIGYGELQKSLIDLISILDLKAEVRVIGALPQDELVAYYQRATVFCLPTVIASNDDRDVLPNVVKEAMAVGVPVVTTSIPAMEELVESQRTGFLVPPMNIQELADALERLLNDGELRRSFAQSSRQVIEQRFDRCKNVSTLLSLFEKYLVPQSVRKQEMC